MSFRRQRAGDSLDLLLDTMCNTFGGIILIAVLVAILGRQEQKLRATADSAEMIMRRISEAENTLRESRGAHSNLTARVAHVDSKRRVELASEKRSLQSALDMAAAETDSFRTNAAPSSGDATARLGELRSQMTQAAAAQADLSNQLATAQNNTRRLKTRSGALTQQAAALQAGAVQKLRLPKEHDTTRAVFPVIVQYGRIYPVQLPNGFRNTSNISFTDVRGGVTVRPQRTAGIDPRGTEWKQTLNQLSSARHYITFYVFDDSFGAFNVAKSMAVASGFEYGWEPQRTMDGALSFGQSGVRPKAQ